MAHSRRNLRTNGTLREFRCVQRSHRVVPPGALLFFGLGLEVRVGKCSVVLQRTQHWERGVSGIKRAVRQRRVGWTQEGGRPPTPTLWRPKAKATAPAPAPANAAAPASANACSAAPAPAPGPSAPETLNRHPRRPRSSRKCSASPQCHRQRRGQTRGRSCTSPPHPTDNRTESPAHHLRRL